MKVQQGEQVREVVAIVRSIDDDGNEEAGFWVQLPDGPLALWPAVACTIIEP